MLNDDIWLTWTAGVVRAAIAVCVCAGLIGKKNRRSAAASSWWIVGVVTDMRVRASSDSMRIRTEPTAEANTADAAPRGARLRPIIKVLPLSGAGLFFW